MLPDASFYPAWETTKTTTQTPTQELDVKGLASNL
jgi:hypothetical protein